MTRLQRRDSLRYKRSDGRTELFAQPLHVLDVGDFDEIEDAFRDHRLTKGFANEGHFIAVFTKWPSTWILRGRMRCGLSVRSIRYGLIDFIQKLELLGDRVDDWLRYSI